MKIYENVFDSNIGTWTGKPYNLPMKQDVEPYHDQEFTVPKIHELTLKTEVDRIVKIGVLWKVNRSQWGDPTLSIPKKDGTVRFISDFREVNKRIRRKPYPIPKIQ